MTVSRTTRMRPAGPTTAVYQRCIHPDCGATFDVGDVRVACDRCGSLLDVAYDWDRLDLPDRLEAIASPRRSPQNPLDHSGVWRFRRLLPFAPENRIVTVGEGQTILQRADRVARYVGSRPGHVYLQYEGFNPSGSFKDNGMAAAMTHARMVGARRAACASTGNTSASLAMYCAVTQRMKAIIFVGSGKIAYGKLSQALDFGGLTVQISGDFDDAMARVREVASTLGIYLVNSVNPFRLEGQKTIMYRILEWLGWEIPDWIVVPGGNLGNSSAFGKAFDELFRCGLIERKPRLAIINAAGANTLYELVQRRGLRWCNGRFDPAIVTRYYEELDARGRRASTIASAIEINRPVNLAKCLRALDVCDGVVREVTDQDILNAKAQIGAGGFGCEPASAATVAGLKLLRAENVIEPTDRVVCVLTGHQLKDPNVTVAYHSADQERFDQVLRRHGVSRASYANRAVAVPNDLDEITRVIQLYGSV